MSRVPARRRGTPDPRRVRRGGKAWTTGRRAERLVGWYLALKGFRTLARNLRTPFGEIDLVVRRGNLVVLVEVKARGLLDGAASALAPAQQARILRAGAWYVGRRPELAGCDQRCDVVLVAPWRWPRHLVGAWDTAALGNR